MSAPPRILLVSNGFGEISILETIARAISRAAPDVQLAHLPLVGRLGVDAWPPAVGPQRAMPSGGLVTYWNLRNILRDLRAGLATLTIRQFAFLAGARKHYDVAVAVGDVYCLAACLVFARLPTVFVATAKSEHVAGHSSLECAIARRAQLVFARDAMTAAALARRGVPARYAGNVMMDGVAAAEFALPVDPDAIRIAVLPGSREDAPRNARDAMRRLVRVAALAHGRVQSFVALAPSVDESEITAALAAEGLALSPTGRADGVVARGVDRDVDVLLVRGGLGAVVHAVDIVFGQAGTGNEQAAGSGRPVIAAADPGESPQTMGWYRMRQKRLLGDALLVLPADDEAFAHETVALLADRARMTAMADAGRERMGGPGAAAAVAAAVIALVRGER